MSDQAPSSTPAALRPDPAGPTPVPSSDIDRLTSEMHGLRAEVAELNSHRFMRVHNKMTALLWLQFLRGLALGLGTAIGASVLLSVTLLVLNQVEFVPILGDLATQVIEEIERAQRGAYVPTGPQDAQPAILPTPEGE